MSVTSTPFLSLAPRGSTLPAQAPYQKNTSPCEPTREESSGGGEMAGTILQQLDPLADGGFSAGEQTLDILAMAIPDQRGCQ